jgi:hypothetical protein
MVFLLIDVLVVFKNPRSGYCGDSVNSHSALPLLQCTASCLAVKVAGKTKKVKILLQVCVH